MCLPITGANPKPEVGGQGRPVARGGGREGASPPLEIISPPLESAGLFFFFFAGLFFCLLVIQLFATCYARFNLNLNEIVYRIRIVIQNKLCSSTIISHFLDLGLGILA